MAQSTLYILYNADSTIFGKLKYGYRKISGSGTEPACAACDITHGGLSLSETPQWIPVKKEIEDTGIKVVQWHRDEVSKSLKDYITSNSVRYPAVVLDAGGENYSCIMTKEDLNVCGGDPKALFEQLQKKNVIPSGKTGSSAL